MFSCQGKIKFQFAQIRHFFSLSDNKETEKSMEALKWGDVLQLLEID